MPCSICKQEGHTKRNCQAASVLVWQPWTAKSESIAFVTNRPGIGDGEDKVGAELGTAALGQNHPYDMDVVLDGASVAADVKKLDMNTFNTGVNGRDALRPIKNRIESLLNRLPDLIRLPWQPSDLAKLTELSSKSPDELCVKTLQLIQQVCTLLYQKQQQLRAALPDVLPMADPYTRAMIHMTAERYYQMSRICDIALPEILQPHQDSLALLSLLDHPYIHSPSQFMTDLQGLVTLFQGTILIFVDEQKGYSIVQNPCGCVQFERITRGHPRFRVI